MKTQFSKDTNLLLKEYEIGKALSLYNRFMFWEYSEREISKLSPELVIPRVTRYGTIEDIIRLFVIYTADRIRQIAESDRELDDAEKIFLTSFCFNSLSLPEIRIQQMNLTEQTRVDPNRLTSITERPELYSLLEVGIIKLDSQLRQNKWDDLIYLYNITQKLTLFELFAAYSWFYPAMPKKQCFMALWKNLKTPPPTEDFPDGMMHGIKTQEMIIYSLKKKCIEMCQSVFDHKTEIVRSELSFKLYYFLLAATFYLS